MINNLALDGIIILPEALANNEYIRFVANVVDLTPDYQPSIDNTSLNLLSDTGDHLLHISFRRREDAIVFNSMPNNGGWGQEERIPLHKLLVPEDTKGSGIIIEIFDRDEFFEVLVGGKPAHNYKKRISLDVKQVSYRVNHPGRSLFGPSITVIFSQDIQNTGPPNSYEREFFPLTAKEIAEDAANEPFDIVIIGSGIGGGVLASDLLEKNKLLSSNESFFTAQSTEPGLKLRMYIPTDDLESIPPSDDKSLKILVIEKGGLLFSTHSLNTARPTSRGTYGQMNDLFYNKFKDQFDMDHKTAGIWAGGPVFCLGGRSAVWGLFSPRININTFKTHFPEKVFTDLNDKYLRKAEEMMKLSYPETRPLHQALIDKLNLRDNSSPLPVTQWQWGRMASEFRNQKNFDFAEGAYSTIDRILEQAMNDPHGYGKFKTLLRSSVTRLEPKPDPNKAQEATHVVVHDGVEEHRIKCKKAVICAGAVESPAILLRSAQGSSLETTFGDEFVENFGHVTDHYIFYVTNPFFYRDMTKKEIIGGVKLQTDIEFDTIDKTFALANISLDASSFLPRRNVPDSDLPQFILAYILPSDLATQNNITLNQQGEPCIKVGYARDSNIKKKRDLLKLFAADVMNKMSKILDIQFVRKAGDNYELLPEKITPNDITLGELGPGGVAHELGSIPMPDASGEHGVLDENLKMNFGWDNVYVCDLSVFPYSPAANPTLSLAALALRLSDHLVPYTQYQPIVVHNLTRKPVFVLMTLSNEDAPFFGPIELQRIDTGKHQTWKRSQNETIQVFSCPCAGNYDLQMVYPGVNAMVVTSPPPAKTCICNSNNSQPDLDNST